MNVLIEDGVAYVTDEEPGCECCDCGQYPAEPLTRWEAVAAGVRLIASVFRLKTRTQRDAELAEERVERASHRESLTLSGFTDVYRVPVAAYSIQFEKDRP